MPGETVRGPGRVPRQRVYGPGSLCSDTVYGPGQSGAIPTERPMTPLEAEELDRREGDSDIPSGPGESGSCGPPKKDLRPSEGSISS